MLQIAICDDEQDTVQENKKTAEECLCQCKTAGKILTYTTSANLLWDITEDHFFFDLILLDIEMPGISGMEIAEKIRPFLPDVKIIFITSHIEYAIDAFELSVFRYVPKQDMDRRLPSAIKDAVRLIALEEEKFEVSRRTINRDIEELCRAGIPLVTTQGVNGGISIMEGYKIDSTLLTSSDMQEILAGLRSLDSVSGTNQVAQLMEKLSAGSSTLMPGGQNILIDLSSWYRDTLAPKIQLIREAMDRRQKICFQYYSPNGESIREVEPYYLIFQWANWYVWGYCAEREDYRLFKLNRMTELKPGETFEKRNVPLPDLSNERLFPHIYQVKALIDPEFRWRLVEEYGPDSFIVQEDGRLLFSFGFTDEESILGWILSYRGGAKLLEPEPLRGKLSKLGRKLEEQYSDS